MIPSNKSTAYSSAERTCLKIAGAILVGGAVALAYACPRILWPEVNKLWIKAFHSDAATLLVQFPPRHIIFSASLKAGLAVALLRTGMSIILASYLATALPSLGLLASSALVFKESRA